MYCLAHSRKLIVAIEDILNAEYSARTVHIAAQKACIPGETIHHLVGDVTPEQLYDALLVADLLGQEYF